MRYCKSGVGWETAFVKFDVEGPIVVKRWSDSEHSQDRGAGDVIACASGVSRATAACSNTTRTQLMTTS